MEAEHELTVVIGIRVREGRLGEVSNQLNKVDSIKAVYEVTGDYDILMIGHFRNRVELEKFIKETLKWKFIERTNTFVAINTVKENFQKA